MMRNGDFSYRKCVYGFSVGLLVIIFFLATKVRHYGRETRNMETELKTQLNTSNDSFKTGNLKFFSKKNKEIIKMSFIVMTELVAARQINDNLGKIIQKLTTEIYKSSTEKAKSIKGMLTFSKVDCQIFDKNNNKFLP